MANPIEHPDDSARADRVNVLAQVRNQILVEGFKGLVLINGGGAAALAAFLQAIWDKPTAAGLRIYLLAGIASLLLGAALAGILFLARYISFFGPSDNCVGR